MCVCKDSCLGFLSHVFPCLANTIFARHDHLTHETAELRWRWFNRSQRWFDSPTQMVRKHLLRFLFVKVIKRR